MGKPFLLLFLFADFAVPVLANDDYLMWQFAEEVSMPVYVYSNGNQVNYIPSHSLQPFAGAYTKGSTAAKFTLYHNAGQDKWTGCDIIIENGSINAAKSCTGAVINEPQAGSNVYTIALGANPWPVVTSPAIAPVPTDYSERQIIFRNNTQHKRIMIGEACTASKNPSNANCRTTPILAVIGQGDTQQYAVKVNEQGLVSSAFYLSGYCTGKTDAECAKTPSVEDCKTGAWNNWVCTGGYFPGEQPYATKIEPTILEVRDGIPLGNSNIDISAVDGYNAGVKVFPEDGAYCTYTVPPEGSNILGAGVYNANSPLAEIQPNEPNGLESLCNNSSQLPGPGEGWDLTLNDGENFKGCMSPCSFAKKHKSSETDLFCCAGRYSTPQACTQPPGQPGANTSTYNTNLRKSTQFKNVYGFAYGDAGDDFACPPQTNFVVEFVHPKP